MTLRMEQFSDRSLERIAAVVAGNPVRLVRSNRVVDPLSIVFESWTVAVNPESADLYDVLLGAAMLRYRGEFHDSPARGGCAAPDWKVAGWVAQSHDYLATLFPRAVTVLRGWHKPGYRREPALPRCDWSELAFAPLTFPFGSRSSLDLRSFPGLNILGVEDDWAALCDELAAGRLEMDQLPWLPEMPVFVLPADVNTIPRLPPDWEHIEMAFREQRRAQESYVDCFVRTSTNEHESRPRWLRSTRGQNIDSSRPVEAQLGLLTATPPRIFRDATNWLDAAFQPEQHVVVHGIDAFATAEAWWSSKGYARWAIDGVLRTAHVFQKLNVHFGMVAFADQVVCLPHGPHVYVHIPITLKDPMDRYDEAFWSRTLRILSKPPRIPGATPMLLPPLALRTMLEMLRTTERKQEHVHRTAIMIAPRSFPDEKPCFQVFSRPHFLSRIAQELDRQLAEADREFSLVYRKYLRGHFSAALFFICKELKESAPKGSRVAKMEVMR